MSGVPNLPNSSMHEARAWPTRRQQLIGPAPVQLGAFQRLPVPAPRLNWSCKQDLVFKPTQKMTIRVARYHDKQASDRCVLLSCLLHVDAFPTLGAATEVPLNTTLSTTRVCRPRCGASIHSLRCMHSTRLADAMSIDDKTAIWYGAHSVDRRLEAFVSSFIYKRSVTSAHSWKTTW